MTSISASSPRFSVLLLSRIFIPFALGYFLSYLYRVVNNVLAGNLANDMGLDAGQLGLLTGVYLIAFASSQLPLGILLDRYGPVKVEAILLLFAAAGAWVFAQAETVHGLMLGRALIGFGVSACLMAAFKAFVQWFPADKLPLVNGLQFTAGGLGILAAAAPVEWALQFTDWRGVFKLLALATLGVAILILMVVPEKPIAKQPASLKSHVRSILAIFTSPRFWLLSPWAITTQAVFMAIMSLWSGPWLRDVAGLEREAVAVVLTWQALGVITGYLFTGLAAERLGRLGITIPKVVAVGLSAFMLVQLALILEWTAAAGLLWFCFGFFGTSGVLAYAHLSQQFPVELAGRVNTALNLLVFIMAFLVQWGVGALIEYWSVAGATHYNPAGYQVALTLLLVLQVTTMMSYFVQARR